MAGCRFELVDYRQTWGEDRVYFYDREGRLKAIPTGWTDFHGPHAFVVISAGRAYFRVHDLLSLADLIADLSKASKGKKV